MNLALAVQDVVTLKTEAHQIKGTAGAMGYPMMTRQAGALEALMKENDPDWSRVRDELSTLNDMIARALAASAASS
jgi:HPt (histidine-containing phosphotransfer) domain-containing protein